jgi:protein ImuA
VPTILAAEDDASREQTWEDPVSERIPNGFLTDSERINPRNSAKITHITDSISHFSRNRPQGVDSLKQTIAAIEAACLLRKGASNTRLHVETGVREIDETLSGGLLRGAVHELMPKSAQDLAAAAGFAFGLAALDRTPAAHTLYIQHDFTAAEYGRPYLPGLQLNGVDTAALIYLNVPRAEDVLWAMGEALKCRGFTAVIAEFPAQTRVLDLTMTRRLALAAQGGGALGLILRHGRDIEPNAATTRWLVSSAPSTPDAFGGLGRPTFHLDLVKNRFGQCGQWRVEWQSHERKFATPPLSRSLARPFADRSDRARALAQTA